MERMGWTQQIFAEKMGCGQPRISAINSGSSEVKYYEILKLIDLGITLEELFGEEKAAKVKESFLPTQCKIDYSSPEFQKGVRDVIAAMAVFPVQNHGRNDIESNEKP